MFLCFVVVLCGVYRCLLVRYSRIDRIVRKMMLVKLVCLCEFSFGLVVYIRNVVMFFVLLYRLFVWLLLKLIFLLYRGGVIVI